MNRPTSDLLSDIGTTFRSAALPKWPGHALGEWPGQKAARFGDPAISGCLPVSPDGPFMRWENEP
jgi:hypothetical protein